MPDSEAPVDLPVNPPIEPMLAKLMNEVPDEGELLFEPKWDGFRALVFRDGDEIFIQSRDKKELNRYFPELIEPLKRSLPTRCVVDGEIILMQDGRLEFDVLQQRIHPAASRVKKLSEETPAQYVAFDLLCLGDESLIETPQVERRARLEKALEGAEPPVMLTPMTRDTDVAKRWFVEFEGAGLDGIVAKPAELAYMPKKRRLLKIKHVRTADCVVAGFRWHKKGPGTLVGSLLLGLYDDDGVLHHVGVTSSFKMKERESLAKELAPLREDAEKDHPWAEWADWETRAENEQRMPGSKSRWSAGKNLAWNPLRIERVCEVKYDFMQGDRLPARHHLPAVAHRQEARRLPLRPARRADRVRPAVGHDLTAEGARNARRSPKLSPVPVAGSSPTGSTKNVAHEECAVERARRGRRLHARKRVDVRCREPVEEDVFVARIGRDRHVHRHRLVGAQAIHVRRQVVCDDPIPDVPVSDVLVVLVVLGCARGGAEEHPPPRAVEGAPLLAREAERVERLAHVRVTERGLAGRERDRHAFADDRHVDARRPRPVRSARDAPDRWEPPDGADVGVRHHDVCAAHLDAERERGGGGRIGRPEPVEEERRAHVADAQACGVGGLVDPDLGDLAVAARAPPIDVGRIAAATGPTGVGVPRERREVGRRIVLGDREPRPERHAQVEIELRPTFRVDVEHGFVDRHRHRGWVHARTGGDLEAALPDGDQAPLVEVVRRGDGGGLRLVFGGGRRRRLDVGPGCGRLAPAGGAEHRHDEGQDERESGEETHGLF